MLVFGVLLIAQRHNPKRIEFENFSTHSSSPKTLAPIEIVIPSLDIHLPIYPSKITNNKWEATEKGISYLSDSPIPGDLGNSILYGHNWENLLGNLPNIKPGEKIYVLLSNKYKKTFVVQYVSIVSPDQSEILNKSSDARITLYTCTGFLDTKRFVVTAILQNS